METITIYGHMCEEQKTEIQEILNSADNLVECATNFAANGGQTYYAFIQARTDFENIIYKTHKHYRKVSTNSPSSIMSAEEIYSTNIVKL